MNCEISPGKKEYLLAHNQCTTSEEEFDCLIEYRSGRINIIAEGDSWFSYIRNSLSAKISTSIIESLQRLGDFNMLNLATPGDEAVGMLSGMSYIELSGLLNKYRKELNFLLFSGGGNDIVGAGDMDRFLNQWQNGMSWNDCINMGEFNKTIAEIKKAYENLIGLRNHNCPDCVIITHTYAYPIPSDVGAEVFNGLIQTKSWVKPYMDAKGIATQSDQQAIIKYMLDQFAVMLRSLATNNRNFVVIDILNAMGPNDWLNEIHLKTSALNRVAVLFYDVIGHHLPAGKSMRV